MSCPLCHLVQVNSRQDPDRDAMQIDCTCCGNYALSGSAVAQFGDDRPPDPRLIAWVRSQSDAGTRVLVTSDTQERVLASTPRYSVIEKQQLLLQWLARGSKFPGDAVRVLPPADWPVIWADRADELVFHLATAHDSGLVRRTEGPGHLVVVITAAGWNRLERAADELIVADRAFVAMAFHNSLDEAWTNGLRKGVRAAGYHAHRVDSDPHIGRIDLKIIGDIRASRFVVADVTLQRAGVYFEAGYALALGRPVIWSVREDDLKNVHFDTRQFNHIRWTTPDDLAEKLEVVIAGVIGRRPAITG